MTDYSCLSRKDTYFSPFLCTNLLVLHSKFRCSTHFALHNNSISAQKHPFSTFLRYLWVGFFSLLLFCSDFFSVYTKRPEEILYCLIIFHLKSILSLYGKAFWIFSFAYNIVMYILCTYIQFSIP